MYKSSAMVLPRLLTAFLCLWVFSACISYLSADPEKWLYENLAYPSVQVYTVDDYNAATQNWDMIQDENGLLYFANSGGILIYDGVNWDLIDTGHPMRAFVKSSTGRIYSAGRNTFGYLKTNEYGKTEYISYDEKIAGLTDQLIIIWELVEHDGNIYGRDANGLVRYNLETGELDFISGIDYVSKLFTINGNLYFIGLQDQEQHFYRLEDDKLVQKYTITGQRVTVRNTTDITGIAGKPKLLLQTGNRYFEFDPVNFERKNEVFPASNRTDYMSRRDNRAYQTAVLKNRYIGIGTIDEGFKLLDNNFDLILHLTEEQGISSNSVLQMREDRDGGVWLLTGNGLTRIGLEHSGRHISRENHVKGNPYRFFRDGENLWFSTSTLLTQYHSEGYTRHSPVTNQIRSFGYLTNPDGEQIVTGISGGNLIFQKDNTFLEAISRRDNREHRTLFIDPRYADFAITGGVNRVTSMSVGFTDEGILTTDYLQSISFDATAMEVFKSPDQDLWFNTLSHSIRISSENGIRGILENLENSNFEIFDETGREKGIPEITGVFLHEEQLYGVEKSTGKLYAINTSDHTAGKPLTYVNFDDTGLSFEADVIIIDFTSYQNRTLIAAANPGYNYPAFYIFDGDQVIDNSKLIKSITGSEISGSGFGSVYAYFLNSNGAWIVPMQELLTQYTYNPGPTLVRRVTTASDSLIFAGGFSAGEANRVKLDYDDRNLRFSFAQPSFAYHRDAINYQTRLSGFEKEWSDWSGRNFREYSNLPEGNYTFNVRARLPNGVITPAGTFSVEILPPWYRTFWAYAGMFLMSIIIILGLIRIRTSHYRKKQQELESVIQERTEDLRREKEALVEAKNALEVKTREVEAITELKDKLFANVSHELRTPLTIVVGNLQNALNKNKNRDEYLTTALNNSQRLHRLIDQILEITRIDGGKSMLDLKPVEPSHFFRTVAGAFESLAESRKIRMNIRVDKKLPVLLLDEDKMQKIIYNLLSNALKFTPENGTVTVEVAALDDDHLQIRVEDNGPGIPSDAKKNLFDRFYKIKLDEKNYTEGLGLGLAITREYVEMHGGTITVSGQQGQGSVFTILMPIRKPESDASVEKVIDTDDTLEESVQAASSEKTSEAFETPVSGGVKVLVVDDNPDMRTYIAGLLRDQGYDIVTAENGKVALDQLRENPEIELVISDIMMPEMNGYELAESLKEDLVFRHLPLIFVTAKAEKEDLMQSLRIGINDYVVKPFNPAELTTRAGNLLEGFSERRKWLDSDGSNKKPEALQMQISSSGVQLPETDSELIERLKNYIEDNLTRGEITVEQLADELAMSRRQVYRKLQEITGFTPAAFIREIRLLYARHLIENNPGINVKTVSYSSGFGSQAHFSKLYKNRFGKTPTEDLAEV